MNSAASALLLTCFLVVVPNASADVTYEFIDDEGNIATLTVPTLSTIPSFKATCIEKGPAAGATMRIRNKTIPFRVVNSQADEMHLAPEKHDGYGCGYGNEIRIGKRFADNMKIWHELLAASEQFVVKRPDLPIIDSNPCSRSIGILYLYYPVPGAQGWYCLKSSSPNAGSIPAPNENAVSTPIASPVPAKPSPSATPDEPNWNLPTPPAEISFPVRSPKTHSHERSLTDQRTIGR